MTNVLESASLDASLFIQIITLFINIFALDVTLEPWDVILKEILGLESGVQIVELLFYIWYRTHLVHTVSDITRFRYYDWAFTTPIMLFSTACYYVYLSYSEKKKSIHIKDILSENKLALFTIFICNALMLLFGYLEEINLLSLTTSTLLGYLSLMGSFGVLYKEFVSKVNKQQPLFYLMFGIWSLYGVAAVLPNSKKNISYNILDIFAKNFYGVFLSYVILSKRKIDNISSK